MCAFEVRAAQVGAIEDGAFEVCAFEVGDAEVGVLEVGAAEVSALEVGCAEVCATLDGVFVHFHFSVSCPTVGCGWC